MSRSPERSLRFVAVLLGLIGVTPGVVTAQRAMGPARPETPPARVRSVPLSQVLTIGPPEVTVGVEDEEGPYLFGSVSDVALDALGFVYVSEYPEGTIKVFDREGKHRMTFGGRGRGPGEFARPLALLHDGDSTLYAAQGDFGTTEMTAKDGRITLRRVFGVGSNFRQFCTLGDTLVAAGWVAGKMVHFLDRDGNPARSFGGGWSADTIELVREVANSAAGMLTCDARSGRIVLTQSGGPNIRAFSRAGDRLWETTLPSFQPTFYFRQGRGYAIVGGLDFAERAVAMPGDRLLVQVGRVDYSKAPRRTSPTAAPAPPVVRRQAYVLDALTGRILSRSDATESLGTLRGNTAYLVAPDPYPTLRRRTITFR